MEPATNQLEFFAKPISPGLVLPLPVPTSRGNPFKRKYRKTYALRHPDKIKAIRKRRYLKYRDRELAKRQENREKERLRNPELAKLKARLQYQRYKSANPEKVRAYKRLYARRRGPWIKLWKIKLRNEFIVEYGGKCTCCGISDKEFLTLEHVNRDGAKHRKECGNNSTTVLLSLKKRGWPKDGYSILCWNCNLATRRGAICPHKKGIDVRPG